MSIFGGGDSTPAPDPHLAEQRKQAEARAELQAEKDYEKSTAGALGRTMGKRGARAFFTGSGAGYSRTLGGANVSGVS